MIAQQSGTDTGILYAIIKIHFKIISKITLKYAVEHSSNHDLKFWKRRKSTSLETTV
jgi:hypothetical protein